MRRRLPVERVYMPRVFVQAGHLAPRQKGHESETGIPGEMELVHAIRDALVAILRVDSQFEPLPMPGQIPWGTQSRRLSSGRMRHGGVASGRGPAMVHHPAHSLERARCTPGR